MVFVQSEPVYKVNHAFTRINNSPGTSTGRSVAVAGVAFLLVRVVATAIGARTENGGRTTFTVTTLKRLLRAFLAALANTPIFVRLVRRIDHRVTERVQWQALAIARSERLLATLVPFALRFIRTVQTVRLTVTDFRFGYAMTVVTLKRLFWAGVTNALAFVTVIFTGRLAIANKVPGDASTVSTLESVRIAARVVLGATL